MSQTDPFITDTGRHVVTELWDNQIQRWVRWLSGLVQDSGIPLTEGAGFIPRILPLTSLIAESGREL